MRPYPVIAIDAALVLVFAVIGRASHGSELTFGGIAQTALPFLVAVVLGSLLGSRLGGGVWWRSGLITWAVTVVLGIALRLLGGETAQVAFVVVTAVVLALFLIGWRLIAELARRRRPATS